MPCQCPPPTGRCWLHLAWATANVGRVKHTQHTPMDVEWVAIPRPAGAALHRVGAVLADSILGLEVAVSPGDRRCTVYVH